MAKILFPSLDGGICNLHVAYIKAVKNNAHNGRI